MSRLFIYNKYVKHNTHCFDHLLIYKAMQPVVRINIYTEEGVEGRLNGISCVNSFNDFSSESTGQLLMQPGHNNHPVVGTKLDLRTRIPNIKPF